MQVAIWTFPSRGFSFPWLWVRWSICWNKVQKRVIGEGSNPSLRGRTKTIVVGHRTSSLANRPPTAMITIQEDSTLPHSKHSWPQKTTQEGSILSVRQHQGHSCLTIVAVKGRSVVSLGWNPSSSGAIAIATSKMSIGLDPPEVWATWPHQQTVKFLYGLTN